MVKLVFFHHIPWNPDFLTKHPPPQKKEKKIPNGVQGVNVISLVVHFTLVCWLSLPRLISNGKRYYYMDINASTKMDW